MQNLIDVPETDGELYARIDALKANNGRKRPTRKAKPVAIAVDVPNDIEGAADTFLATFAAVEFAPEDGETQEAINAAMDTFGLTAAHVETVQCAMETGLTAEEACAQVADDDGPRAAETVILPAGNTPVAVDAANTTAQANPLLAPKGAPKVNREAIAAKVALTLTPEQATKRAKFAAEKAVLDDEEATVKIAEYELVERLLAEGKSRPAISKETGITYSRLTYVRWHIDRGLPTPGMIPRNAG